MKLKDWLDANGLSVGDFAKRIDRTSETVRRYVAGERVPDRDTMPMIFDQTSGAVTANDFFGLAERTATCPVCDMRADDPQVRNCVASNCGLAARERVAA